MEGVALFLLFAPDTHWFMNTALLLGTFDAYVYDVSPLRPTTFTFYQPYWLTHFNLVQSFTGGLLSKGKSKKDIWWKVKGFLWWLLVQAKERLLFLGWDVWCCPDLRSYWVFLVAPALFCACLCETFFSCLLLLRPLPPISLVCSRYTSECHPIFINPNDS